MAGAAGSAAGNAGSAASTPANLHQQGSTQDAHARAGRRRVSAVQPIPALQQVCMKMHPRCRSFIW